MGHANFWVPVAAARAGLLPWDAAVRTAGAEAAFLDCEALLAPRTSLPMTVPTPAAELLARLIDDV